ncbi:MAG TPA: formylglycine-generating enzyme family protein [Acidimicrobiales bacterium]|nr:formylglycine-generating enzyme family protein [Acidimicrobiales bacterium]
MSDLPTAPASPPGPAEPGATDVGSTAVVDAGPPGPAPHPGMVWVPGGTFLMGSDDHYPEEAPAHRVTVAGLWMDRLAATNDDFARFVRATGHVTVAERAPDPADYPDARPDLLVAASSVFRKPGRPVSLDDAYRWWALVPGADWRHPRGPQSSIRDLGDHPVVHVAWSDVEAYAAWAGKQLPTEAEWERAARGGLEGAEFAWGDELVPGGRHMANWWQGDFPNHNSRDDGFEYSAPAKSFPPNGFGLFQMTGNVWEWTSDWYQDRAAGAPEHACCAVPDPRGGTRDGSVVAGDPAAVPRKVMKGGSHLCAPSYCRRYRPAARMAQAVDTSTSHLGFRCVVRP